jgi:hypothetical protein
MEFKELYSLFENKTIHRLLAKKKLHPVCGPFGPLLVPPLWPYEFPYRQIKPQNTIFSFLWWFWINLWVPTGRHLDMMYTSFLTARPALKNTDQPHQNLHWELGLANKLDILCCWVIFRLIITLLSSVTLLWQEFLGIFGGSVKFLELSMFWVSVILEHEEFRSE